MPTTYTTIGAPVIFGAVRIDRVSGLPAGASVRVETFNDCFATATVVHRGRVTELIPLADPGDPGAAVIPGGFVQREVFTKTPAYARALRVWALPLDLAFALLWPLRAMCAWLAADLEAYQDELDRGCGA